MQFVIVTGMSGAGKSTALNVFEDLGYYCVDNLPPVLLKNFADFCLHGGSGIEQVALGTDIRGGRRFDDLYEGLRALEANNLPYTILFLDASDETLLIRYKETRRNHPLNRDDIAAGIAEERSLLRELKHKSNYVLDTSMILARQLREQIIEIFLERKAFGGLIAHVQSFGFKYGILPHADLVFDVRFLPNPFYLPELKELTGMDKAVYDFVMDTDVCRRFLSELSAMMEFLIPNYTKEGKNQLVIGVGCTGGKHRSVAVARGLYDALLAAGHSVYINHRDVSK